MNLAYIRKHYNVPAKVGARVEWTDPRGQKWAGTIAGCAEGARLKIRFDADRDKATRRILHPTDNVRYLPPLPSPKDRVLERYPCAYAAKTVTGYKIRSRGPGESGDYRLLGFARTAKAAWADAAQVISAPQFRGLAYKEIHVEPPSHQQNAETNNEESVPCST